MSHALATSVAVPSVRRHPVRMRRLLIPVKRPKEAGRAVSYAIRRRAEGCGVAVCLLHVEEAPSQWQALVGGGMPDGRRRQASDVFGVAMRMLEGLDIEFAAYVRSGPIVFAILDAAEELACDEIVVPAKGSGLFSLLSRRVVPVLKSRQRSARLVTVSNCGEAVV